VAMAEVAAPPPPQQPDAAVDGAALSGDGATVVRVEVCVSAPLTATALLKIGARTVWLTALCRAVTLWSICDRSLHLHRRRCRAFLGLTPSPRMNPWQTPARCHSQRAVRLSPPCCVIAMSVALPIAWSRCAQRCCCSGVLQRREAVTRRRQPSARRPASASSRTTLGMARRLRETLCRS
jgi:hypothetical protein